MSAIRPLLKKIVEGRATAEDAVKTLTESPIVKSGDSVRVLTGTFTGATGKVVSVDGAYAVVQTANNKIRVLVTRCKAL